jgi:uncharacterized membrane protein YgcG
MLQTFFTARSARPIAAFLIMGSLMGFVAGQRLGHPVTVARHPVAAHTATLAQHASGGLGTPVVQTLAARPPAHPADQGGHGKHDKPDGHGDSKSPAGDGGGGSGGSGGGNGGGGD